MFFGLARGAETPAAHVCSAQSGDGPMMPCSQNTPNNGLTFARPIVSSLAASWVFSG
jgi:hypothetical protein